ncbi:heavy metal translocating P-type ATPase [Rhizobium bangladeshense]|uniref:heavy metal translocating P-type ATPase n=1 Tax=Rhizobium bangladeshense TaxID=1138189 RepID=UPI0007E5741A|nr:heavy metal translocating P-type ATPase [Rhizobium bangladeshense]
MTCCTSSTAAIGIGHSDGCSPEEVAFSSQELRDGVRQITLSVPEMHCASCIRAIENALAAVDGVEAARANLSLRTVVVNWKGDRGAPPDLTGALSAVGYSSHLPTTDMGEEDRVHSHLLRALAVAGFCSMNIMLLSVSVWAGADAGTRQAFHLLSAALALPAVVYSGSAFYASAWRALVHGRMNMDVPISAGVLLSFGLSLYDAIGNAAQAYFEASTSLLFVVLGGRMLDHMMRRRAKSAVAGLARIMPQGANLVEADGSVGYVPLKEVHPGSRLLVAVGSRVPTDGIVVEGRSEVDSSLVSGESAWQTIDLGSRVRAGAINQGAPFVLTASVAPADSLLSEMTRMLAATENSRSTYRRLADRAAALYAPVVHSLSLLALIGWFYGTGDIHRALTIAIAVLVITCPCALGIAVPMVQVVLARRLFDRGVMATDGSAFERLAGIDTVVFDKTGTLTTGQPSLLNLDEISEEHLAIAGSMARLSRHPISMALSAAHSNSGPGLIAFDETRELAGYGLEATIGADIYRLGKAEWAAGAGFTSGDGEPPPISLSRNGQALATFTFGETLRPGAADLVKSLQAKRIGVRILSGDSEPAVARIAHFLNIEGFSAGLLPGEKVTAIADLQVRGHKVLMVGDGINDAAALRAAHVSMAPSTASDVGRSAADFVFLGDSLSVVDESLEAVNKAMGLVRQNFALAVIYNIVSLPLALAGFVTPLIATVAMSSSSILVVANALRLSVGGKQIEQERMPRPHQVVEARA